MQRRDLLRFGTAAALGLGLSPLATAEEPRSKADERRMMDWDRILVLIELKGGNDGLNTLVPYTDADYYRLRPNLNIPADSVLRLTPTLGFNPVCQPLMDAWQAQELAIVQGTGYARPNRSHFRGIDIWHGGTDSDDIARDGWLARLLDDTRRVHEPADLIAHAIVWGHSNTVGHGGLGPLFGRHLETLVMNRPEDFLKRARKIDNPTMEGLTEAHQYILKANRDLVKASDRLGKALGKAPGLKGDWPRHRFARHLQQTARLIGGGARLPVYKLTLDGFDTHAGQRNRHTELLTTLAGSLAAFRATCQAAGVWDKVLVMTYSEFGRRVAGNDSNGTDHGTAAPHFYLGGKVKGGLYGEQPGCGRLQNGDLIATLDYRSLYTTAAEQWLGYHGEFLDRQSRYKAIPLIKA